MSPASSSRPVGRRILGFGKHREIAAAVQEKLCSLGFQATIFVLTNDEAGDARLRGCLIPRSSGRASRAAHRERSARA